LVRVSTSEKINPLLVHLKLSVSCELRSFLNKNVRILQRRSFEGVLTETFPKLELGADPISIDNLGRNSLSWGHHGVGLLHVDNDCFPTVRSGNIDNGLPWSFNDRAGGIVNTALLSILKLFLQEVFECTWFKKRSRRLTRREGLDDFIYIRILLRLEGFDIVSKSFSCLPPFNRFVQEPTNLFCYEMVVDPQGVSRATVVLKKVEDKSSLTMPDVTLRFGEEHMKFVRSEIRNLSETTFDVGISSGRVSRRSICEIVL
jgi:hypothetical protein